MISTLKIKANNKKDGNNSAKHSNLQESSTRIFNKILPAGYRA